MLRTFENGRRLLPGIADDACAFLGGLFPRPLQGFLSLNPRLFPALISKFPTPDARLFDVRPSLYLRGLDNTLGLAFRFENSLNLRLQRYHTPLAPKDLAEL